MIYKGVLFFALLAIVTGFRNGPRIINGEKASTSTFPYIAYLRSPSMYCGASIIDKRWLLTAAHCIARPGPYLVVINKGTHGEEKTLGVKQRIQHPEYNIKYMNIDHGKVNDIGLVELFDNDVITADNCITPVTDTSVKFEDAICQTAGWGRSVFPELQDKRLLMKTVGKLMPRVCIDSMKAYKDKKLVCFHNRASGGCMGDSGGPMVCDNHLVGVTQSAEQSCNPIFPTIFTRVSAYTDWIKSVTGIEEFGC